MSKKMLILLIIDNINFKALTRHSKLKKPWIFKKISSLVHDSSNFSFLKHNTYKNTQENNLSYNEMLLKAPEIIFCLMFEPDVVYVLIR